MTDSEASWDEDIAAWRARNPGVPVGDQAPLVELHLRHADAFSRRGDIRGLDAYDAAEHTLRACTSTSCGSEGLAMMDQIYRIRAAKARLHERLGGTAQLRSAWKIWSDIAADSSGKWAEPDRRRVQWRLRGVPAPLVRAGGRRVLGGVLVVAALVVFGPAVFDGSLPVAERAESAAVPLILLAIFMAPIRRGPPAVYLVTVSLDRDSVCAGDDTDTHAVERRVRSDVPVAVFVVNLMHTYLPGVVGPATWTVRISGPRGSLQAVLVQRSSGSWESPQWRLGWINPKRETMSGFSSVRFDYRAG